ncbi:polyhomeotic-like protein 3 isoform X2 [Nothobranchius furzeri]|uniref:polyhomeotic-like protein 3 isoform X2 n=1 Tax=Nothobranchius furzeri TaxID=105023 RepID=UPI0039047A83
MMDKELLRQNQSEQTSNGSAPSTPTTPTPPRLIPNPMLLDLPAPTPTPTTSSPPPPLTPAPSVSASHGPKAAVGGALSPHILVPAPPKPPTLRTYSRPILPSNTPKAPPHPSSSITAPPPSSTSSSSHTSTSLTNGSTRAGSTPTPITTFHNPASPPGRQVSSAHPVGTPGHVRANQSPSPVRLLGKGLKGSGQDQLILTSAMRPARSSSSSSSSSSSNTASAQLQSLTLRPPPPGTLTIPPSLRLKPPSSVPLLSRPNTPTFPPLRPRPQPSTTATESPATPSRHLPVPPPSLYSPVRAVPLRPRLHPPNSHRAASPRQSSPLHPVSAAPSSLSRTRPGIKSCPLTQTLLGPGPSQRVPLSSSSPFERSAARQLQIIALSSGRQPHPGHAALEPPELSGQSKRSEILLPLPQTSSSLTPGPTSPLSQTLTQKVELKDRTEPGEKIRGIKSGVRDERNATKDVQVEKEVQQDQVKEEEEPETGREEESMDVTEEGEKDGESREKKEEEEGGETPMEQSENPVLLQHQNTGPVPVPDTVKDSSLGLTSAPVQKPLPGPRPGPGPAPGPGPGPGPGPIQTSGQGLKTPESTQTPGPAQRLGPVQKPGPGPGSVLPPGPKLVQTPRPVHRLLPGPVQKPEPGLGPGPGSVPPPGPGLVQTPESVSVPEVLVQKLQEPQRDLQPISQEDLCENMSTQSDNQSALSSLSSQSPPSSPFIASSTPSSEHPPPLLPAHPAPLAHLSPPPEEEQKVDKTPSESQPDAEPLCQSEDETESLGQSMSGPWEMKAWPEGRQVLTHLVEGFIIQEGLEPFPQAVGPCPLTCPVVQVNRSSLLVPDQVTKPQEVNRTNGRVELPVTETVKPAEQSTDSDEDGGGANKTRTRSGHKDRAVLHCQFCGKRGHAHNFMRSKRFCSTSCARGFNVRLTKRLRALSAGSRSERPRPALNRAESVPGKPLLLRLPRDLWSAGRREKEGKEKAPAPAVEQGEEEEELRGGGEEEEEDAEQEDPAVAMAARTERQAARRVRRASAPAVTTSTPTTTFRPAPSQWSVEEVASFIHTLPGCSDVAEAFRLQEIDGQALLLLTEDHLMTSMNIKLGPALKICAHINALKNQ